MAPLTAPRQLQPETTVGLGIKHRGTRLPHRRSLVSEFERRLEAAFDRYNRAAFAGIEPTLALFLNALEAEGLQLSPTTSKVDDTLTASVLECLRRHGVERAKAAAIADDVARALAATLRRLDGSGDPARLLATSLGASHKPPEDGYVRARRRVHRHLSRDGGGF